jgi:hypothetical protein
MMLAYLGEGVSRRRVPGPLMLSLSVWKGAVHEPPETIGHVAVVSGSFLPFLSIP